MKKKFLKFLAVLSCLVMVMSVTAFAADSPNTGDNSGTEIDSPDTGDNSGTDSPDTGDNSGSVSPDTGSNSGTTDNNSGSSDSSTPSDPYQIPATNMAEGVSAPSVIINGVEVPVTIKAASQADVTNAKTITAQICGDKAELLNVVDISLPEGDYSAGVDVKINVEGVKAGDSIVVLHWSAQKGIWENLPVTNVSDGSVTATFTSFSPVAIVRTEEAARTGYEAPVALIAVLLVAAAGAAFCVRRRAIAE